MSAQPRAREALLNLPRRYQSQRWLIAIAFIYSLSPVLVVGTGPLASLSVYIGLCETSILSTMAVSATIILPCYLGYMGLTRRPPRLFPYLLGELRDLASRERITLIFPALLACAGSFAAFTAWKVMIPWIKPFNWDPSLSYLERKLYGGYELWQFLQPIFGYPLATHILDTIYPASLAIGTYAMFWQIFNTHNLRLRHQYLMTCLLSWIILGTVMAVIFSSAGPCFFDKVTEKSDYFVPLMRYLRTVSRQDPLVDVQLQGALWLGYQHPAIREFSGISAMPSMHISMITLVALLAWRLSSWLGALFTGLGVLIFIASVELGWHYSLDGYVGAAGTIVIWVVVGRLQRKNE